MNSKWGITILLLISLVFRILLIPVARHGDINNNTSWGQLLLSRGTVNFYEHKEWTYSAPNQPPLYLAVFGVTSLIQNTTNTFIHWANTNISIFPSKVIWWFDQWGELYIAKIPGIVADLAIGFLLYRLIKGKKGLVVATLWLVNPVAWYNSAIWGGTDSIVNLLGILSVAFLYKKKLSLSAVFFTASVLFKGSLLIFLPLWLIVSIQQKHTQQLWIKAFLFSILLFIIVTLPFHPQIDLPIWFYNLYTNRFLPGEIGSLTANAFNLWWLVNPGQVLDNTLFFGIPARLLGIILTVSFALPILWKAKYSSNKSGLWLSFGLLSFISFMFMTRIHERYLYPFFPLATLSVAFYPWLLLPYVLLSFVHILNLYNLFWAPGIPALENFYLNPHFAEVLSIINLITFLLIYVYFLTRQVKTPSPVITNSAIKKSPRHGKESS